MRENEKVLKRFDASPELLMKRIGLRDEEVDAIGQNGGIEEGEKRQLIGAKRAMCVDGVLGEVGVLVDTSFNEFSETKSSLFLKRVLASRSFIDTRLFRKTWRTLNCSPKATKVIRENQG